MLLVKIAGITKAVFHLVTLVTLIVFYQTASIALLQLVVARTVRAKDLGKTASAQFTLGSICRDLDFSSCALGI